MREEKTIENRPDVEYYRLHGTMSGFVDTLLNATCQNQQQKVDEPSIPSNDHCSHIHKKPKTCKENNNDPLGLEIQNHKCLHREHTDDNCTLPNDPLGLQIQNHKCLHREPVKDCTFIDLALIILGNTIVF